MNKIVVTIIVLIASLMAVVAVSAANHSIDTKQSSGRTKKDPHASLIGMPMLVKVGSSKGNSFSATFLDLDETKQKINNLVIAPYDKRHYKAYTDLKNYGSISFSINDAGCDTSRLHKLQIGSLKSGQIVGVMVKYPTLKSMMKTQSKNLEVVAVISADTVYPAWRMSRVK